jgi:hypothetical protein
MVLWINLQQLISKDIDEDYKNLFTMKREWIEENSDERRKILELKHRLNDILIRLRFDYDELTDEEKENIEKELDEIDPLI